MYCLNGLNDATFDIFLQTWWYPVNLSHGPFYVSTKPFRACTSQLVHMNQWKKTRNHNKYVPLHQASNC